MKTPRPTKDVQQSFTVKVTTGCGVMYITVCADKAGITDILVKLGKNGGCASAQAECLAALLSSALKSGVDPQVLIRDLIGVRCSTPYVSNDGLGEDVLSCGDAIGKFLKYYFENKLARELALDDMANDPDLEIFSESVSES